MINLLPPDEKRQLHAARANTLLARYNILLLCVVGFMGLAIGVVYIYLTNTEANATNAIKDNQARVVQYADVANKAKVFRENLTTAKQILDNEVTYTKVILEVSQALPKGVILQNLNLDAETFGSETTLTANAKDYSSALALKDSFSKSPLFANVHFQNISVGDSQSSGYPVTVNLNVTIKKDVAK